MRNYAGSWPAAGFSDTTQRILIEICVWACCSTEFYGVGSSGVLLLVTIVCTRYLVDTRKVGHRAVSAQEVRVVKHKWDRLRSAVLVGDAVCTASVMQLGKPASVTKELHTSSSWDDLQVSLWVPVSIAGRLTRLGVVVGFRRGPDVFFKASRPALGPSANASMPSCVASTGAFAVSVMC